MKKFYILLFVILFSKNYSQIVNIPDVNFKLILLQASATNNIAKDLAGNSTKIDQNNDGEIQVSEAENISKISINNRNIEYIYYFFRPSNFSGTIKEIYSLEGISSFKNLKLLDCSFAKLSSIDFTNLSSLTEIYCTNNLITAFNNFQNIKSLFALDCSNNQMTSLDLSNSSSVDLPNFETKVLFRFNNNNFQNLNLQNNRQTSWLCLCSPIDGGDCLYSADVTINACKYTPGLSGNPNLQVVKINCGEKFNYEMTYGNTFNFVENCGVAATQESDFANKFKIYPNPAKDFISIETNEKVIEISVFDYSGKLVSKHERNFNIISVTQLPKGNYVMKIKTQEKTFNYKFIKN